MRVRPNRRQSSRADEAEVRDAYVTCSGARGTARGSENACWYGTLYAVIFEWYYLFGSVSNE